MQTLSADQLVDKKLGHYRVERLLGRGRLNAVYLVQHPAYNSSVALTTFILPEYFSAEARNHFLQRFTQEAAVLTTLDHPHIMPVYDYGEQFGYPYLVTPYMMHGSLAEVLKRQGHCSYIYTLELLEQVATGLEYAHNNDIIHGMLKPSNIVFNSEKKALVAGFGLMSILQAHSNEPSEQPHAHLLSVAGTFLPAPEYIAPEVVQGQAMDARSDIYSLGIILFEMLSGSTPFTGSSPLDIAMQHVQQPLPSLRAYVPEIPIAMESVVNHALARTPGQRFQHVSELVEALTQVCSGVANSRSVLTDSAKLPILTSTRETPSDGIPSGDWQLTPPISTGKLTSIHVEPLGATSSASPPIDSWQIVPPIVTGHLVAVQPSAHADSVVSSAEGSSHLEAPSSKRTDTSPKVLDEHPPLVKVIEPEAVGEDAVAASVLLDKPAQLPDAGAMELGRDTSDPHKRTKSTQGKRSASSFKRPHNVGRRRVVAALATGGVVAVGALIAMKMSLTKVPNIATNKGSAPTPMTKTTSNTPVTHTVAHTGTVIGSTTLATNSAVAFNNPVDGKASLLIHLPGGNFVAYEKACTHEGVLVNYDPRAHLLVCPAHGAIFDPAHGAKVVQGPAQTPLAHVAVHVNADGTITAS